MSLPKRTKQAFVGAASLLTAAMPYSALAQDFDGARAQPVASYTTQNESRLVERSDGVLWYQQGQGGYPTSVTRDVSAQRDAIIILADAAPDNVEQFIAGAKGVARWLGKQPGVVQDIYVAATDMGAPGTGGFTVYRDGYLFAVDGDASMSSGQMIEHLNELGRWASKPVSIASNSVPAL